MEAKLQLKHFVFLFTGATQYMCGDVCQLLSEEGHVGLRDVNALQYCDRGFSL